MTHLAKATQLSLAIHALLVLCGLLVIRSASHEAPPLVLDFSLASVNTALAATGPPPGDETSKPPSRIVSETLERPRIVHKEQKKKPRQQLDKVHKETKPARRPQQPAPRETTPQSPQDQELAAPEEKGPDAAGADAPASGTAESASAGGKEGNDNQAAGGPQGGKGGNNGGGVPSSYEYVRRLIMNNLSFPAAARKMGLSGTMVVTFFLKGNGQPDEIAISTSSGHEILDTAVVTTIRRITPFPRPPAPARLIIPIIFNLK